MAAETFFRVERRIHARYPAGSHTIYVGEVVASNVPEEEAPPLIYWNRGYRKLGLHEEPEG